MMKHSCKEPLFFKKGKNGCVQNSLTLTKERRRKPKKKKSIFGRKANI